MTHDLRLLAAFYRYPEAFQAFRNINAWFWENTRDASRLDKHAAAKNALIEVLLGRPIRNHPESEGYDRMWSLVSSLESVWDSVDRPEAK